MSLFRKKQNEQIKSIQQAEQDRKARVNQEVSAILEREGMMIVNILVDRPKPKETTAQATIKE